MVSMPPSDNANVAAVRLPASVRVRVTPSADCRGADGLYGETLCVNGLKTLRAVYSDDGRESGRVSRKGHRTEGVDVWRDLFWP